MVTSEPSFVSSLSVMEELSEKVVTGHEQSVRKQPWELVACHANIWNDAVLLTINYYYAGHNRSVNGTKETLISLLDMQVQSRCKLYVWTVLLALSRRQKVSLALSSRFTSLALSNPTYYCYPVTGKYCQQGSKGHAEGACVQ